MRAELRAALLCLLAAVPAAARPRKSLPDARALLLGALRPPAEAYAAKGRVQWFAPGEKPRGMGITVYAHPDGRRRREARKSPRRPPETILLDAGATRTFYWPRLRTAWIGRPERESAEERRRRLLSFYEVSTSTGGRVAKRPTWRLDLRDRSGRVRRSFWVARAGGLLLKTEDYRADGTLARRERLTRIEPLPEDPGLFRLELPEGSVRAPLSGPPAAGPRLPGWVPEGFLPLEAGPDGRGGTTVVYGDGVARFQVLIPARGRAAAAGELPDDDLARAAASVPDAGREP